MKKLLLIIAAVGITMSAAAQNYNYGIGVRLSPSPSFDFKWNHAPDRSWEFNLNFVDFHGLSVSAAYQWNWALGSQGYNGEGFNAYVGPAASLGFYGFNGNGGALFGVGAMGGIEYKFNIPLALAIDWKPIATIVTGTGNGFGYWGFWDFGIAVRYAF